MPKKEPPFETKKGSKKKEALSPAAQIQHYNAVLIEDLKSEFRFVVEHMSGIEKRLTDRMDKTDSSNNERFDRIEAVLKLHSQMWERNDKRWQENEKNWEENKNRWDQNEKRLERIETKLDHVAEKVERHDQEIQEIKTQLPAL